MKSDIEFRMQVAQQQQTRSYSTASLTPPPSPHADNADNTKPRAQLSDLLAHARIAARIAPHLLLVELLHLARASRGVRAALYARHLPELARAQHVALLLAASARCKSPHRAPVRIGVGACVWCGEGVCKVRFLSSAHTPRPCIGALTRAATELRRRGVPAVLDTAAPAVRRLLCRRHL